MLKFFSIILANSGFKNPWGGYSGGPDPRGTGNNDKKSDKPREQNNESDKPKNPFGNQGGGGHKDEVNFGEFAKKIRNFANNLKRNGENGGGGNNNFKGNGGDLFASQNPKSFWGLVVMGAVLLWLLLGLYKVNPDENAVVLYFKKFYSISTPGLNYHVPYPFGQVIKKSVTTVNTEEFGFSSNKKIDRNLDAESLMLTGDENIVDIEFQVQWQISDIKDFIFNIAEPNQTIRKTAESAMREIIARTPIAYALSDGKRKIELETKDLLQSILDSYKLGVRITLVQLRRVDPPSQVIDAFRDVQTAKADKEKEINQAQSYANDIIPRARGMAAKIKEDASAYSQEVVTNSHGEAERFMSVYRQYIRAKQVTKKRLYLETMEKIYRNMDKIFIDKSVAKSSLMPYFPMNEIGQQSKAAVVKQ